MAHDLFLNEVTTNADDRHLWSGINTSVSLTRISEFENVYIFVFNNCHVHFVNQYKYIVHHSCTLSLQCLETLGEDWAELDDGVFT